MHLKTEPEPVNCRADLQGTESCTCFNLRKAARAVTQLFDAGLKSTGIRSTQFALLVVIAKLAPVSVGSLARTLVIDRTTLSRSLRLMQTREFIAISPRSTERRRFVTLRPTGWSALARSLPSWRDTQRRFVDEVGDHYWNAMQKELAKLSNLTLADQKVRRGANSTAY